MKQDKQQNTKDTVLMATGLLTEAAFLSSLKQSTTLKVMVLVFLCVFAGLGYLLYHFG